MFHVKHSLSTSTIEDSLIIDWQQQVQQRKKELNQYAEQLMWWNSRINLLSRDVSRETIRT
jgi:16S rRNA (guanine527-N7)-methyltransferase